MILAPAIMAAEKVAKNAAGKCLEAVGLDPDMYRIGHTKARIKDILSPVYPTICISKRMSLLQTYH